jgi:hypothetical protein
LVDFTKRWLASETELSSTKREVVKQLLTFLQDLPEEATIDDFTFLMEDKVLMSTASFESDSERPKDKGFLDFSPQKLAAQLTLKEFAIFRSTSPSEFLNDAWRLKHRHELSPHVLQLLYHTNQAKPFNNQCLQFTHVSGQLLGLNDDSCCAKGQATCA